MTKVTHIVGVDPGLVHTGVVRLLFKQPAKELLIETHVIDGLDAEAVNEWTYQTGLPRPKVYVEKYRPRQNLSADTRMVQGERDLKREIPAAILLSNTGVKKVATEPLMRAMGLWSFKQSTHHQDLRSAARIAVLGMMKDEALNVTLSDLIRAHLNGKPWTIGEV